MRHRKLQLLVSTYLDGEIAEADKTIVLSHVKTCPKCRHFIGEAKIMREALKALGVLELPRTFASQVAYAVEQREERSEEWLGIAPLARNTFYALAVVVLLIFSISLFSNGTEIGSGDQFISAISGESASVRVLLQQEDLSRNDMLYAAVIK
jgi:anti-sigma factor RsiW